MKGREKYSQLALTGMPSPFLIHQEIAQELERENALHLTRLIEYNCPKNINQGNMTKLQIGCGGGDNGDWTCWHLFLFVVGGEENPRLNMAA